jgi:hypothetical protein
MKPYIMWVSLIVVIVSAVFLTSGIYEKADCDVKYVDQEISNSETNFDLIEYKECQKAKDLINFSTFGIIVGVAMFATIYMLRD